MCGASSFIQTQRRPVTQQVHAQHLPVIHVPHVQRGCVGAITMLAVLGGVGAAIAGIVVSYLAAGGATAMPPLPSPSPPALAPQAGTGVVSNPAPPSTAPSIEEDYFADASRVKARYQAALGKPIMAKELVIFQYYATLEAQDRKKPDHVDSYKLWANKVERPQAVRLGSDKGTLGQILFSLDRVDFAIVPRLLKQALAELKIEEGKVTHVYLERDSSNGKPEPIWRVYVNGSRDSGFVEFSVTGEKLREAK
jgi:hypothetical protein